MFERCIYFNVNALSRKINRIWKEAYEAVNLSPSHAYLLRLVLAEPGLSQQTIANTLTLEKSTITRFINKLEADGFIVRKIPTARNTREQVIYPTQKAYDLHDELEAIGNRLYADMLQTVGEDELRKLVGDIRKAGDKV